MSRKLVIIVFLIGSWVYAQKSIDSPYSFYGLGQVRHSSTEEYQLMGGVSTYVDSVRVSLVNPALYGGLKYTSFAMGTTFSQHNLGADVGRTNNISFDYLTLGFPIIQNWGLGIGVAPYTSTGYKTSFQQTENNQNVLYHYQGQGDISRIFVSSGYQVLKGLYLGVTANLNFGSTEKEHIRAVDKEQLSIKETTKSYIKGVSYQLGVVYKREFLKKWVLTTEMAYTPKSTLYLDNNQSISTLEISPDTGEFVVRGSYDTGLSQRGLLASTLVKPWQWRAGVSFGEDKKWIVALNYEGMGFSEFENPLTQITQVSYQNAHRISVGGFFIPQYNSFTSYFKQVTYRLGGYYHRGAVVLKQHSIDDFGISFGVTLPVIGLSDFTVGGQYGQRGTLQSDLLKENYWKVKIGFSLSDKWFQRSKIK